MQLVSAPTLTTLIGKVNALGFTPACGVTYHEGLYWQPVTSTPMSGVGYAVVDTADDVSFGLAAADAEQAGAVAIGELLIVNGRYIQAYGMPAIPTDSAAVLDIINAATVGDEDYAGLTAYVMALINSTGALAEDAPEVAGLRLFIQKVIDAQP